MVQKQCILRKIMYWSPGKLLEIVNFDEKSRKSHGENPKHILIENASKPRQNMRQIRQNRRKSRRKKQKFAQQKSKDIVTKRQNRIKKFEHTIQICQNRRNRPKSMRDAIFADFAAGRSGRRGAHIIAPLLPSLRNRRSVRQHLQHSFAYRSLCPISVLPVPSSRSYHTRRREAALLYSY